MQTATHLLVYRRFFASLLSVLPGVNLVLGLGALTLFLVTDVIGVDWGWGVGVAAVVLALTFLGWILAGVVVQRWAENKSTGVLFGINAPFILFDAIFMGWLFVRVVIHAPSLEEHSAVQAVQVLSSLV